MLATAWILSESEHEADATLTRLNNKDGSFVQGHDGEESETTLVPFYGFCKADDPMLLHHASLAMTKENPLYSPDLDAIW